MWNIFKSKKRKQEERLLAEKRVAQVKFEIELINQKVDKIVTQMDSTERERFEKANSVCPKCSSKNVNDRIKRQQGELKGDFQGSGWSALTFGSSSSYGKIRGKLDTNEVNKCNDCEHEWKKQERQHNYHRKVLESQINYVRYALQEFHDSNNCKFDALDVEEKYSSLAEKKSALLSKAKNGMWVSCIKSFWSGTSLDTFNHLSEKNLNSHEQEYLNEVYDEGLLISFGFKKLKNN